MQEVIDRKMPIQVDACVWPPISDHVFRGRYRDELKGGDTHLRAWRQPIGRCNPAGGPPLETMTELVTMKRVILCHAGLNVYWQDWQQEGYPFE